MAENEKPEVLVAVLKRLSAQLPPNLNPPALRQFIDRHCDWEQEFPEPTQRAQFEERVYRELLSKIQTVGVTLDHQLCPQCGRSFSSSHQAASGVVCSACGFQSQAIFSVVASVSSAVVAAGKLPDRFELKAFLGEGTFGVVYQAWDSKLQRDVAIKIPKAERLNRDIFLREARAASRLSHPNIVRIYDVGELGEQTFIVSDLISGTTLGRWAATTKPSIKTACEVMLKIAQAVEHAHQSDVIHRDLKPGNILIDHRLDPVVLDFGLSHSRSLKFESIAKHGSPVGTPAFMSPEQVQGQLDRIDTWTDVYGMGVILYQLVTDTLPFMGASENIYDEIVHREVAAPRKRNSKIAPALEAIILKAMQKKPEQRYATARELADDLQGYLAGEPVSAYRKVDARVVATYSRRYFMPTVASLSVGGLLGGWAWWRSERQANNPLVSVRINSEPAAAELTWVRLDPETAAWDAANQVQSKAGEFTRLPPGFYKIIARSGNTSFEVFRTVSTAEQSPIVDYLGIGRLPHRFWRKSRNGYELPTVRIPSVDEVASGMAFIAGGRIEYAWEPQYPTVIRGEKTEIGDFLIDRREITYESLLKVFRNYKIAHDYDPRSPAEMITWDVAVAYAEAVGKNIPTLWELLYVATNSGTTSFPWGAEFGDEQDLKTLQNRLNKIDWTRGDQPVYDLVGGMAEWTVSMHGAIRDPGSEKIMMPADINQIHVFGWDHLAAVPVAMIRGTGVPPFYVADGRRPLQGVGFRCVRRLAD